MTIADNICVCIKVEVMYIVHIQIDPVLQIIKWTLIRNRHINTCMNILSWHFIRYT